MTPSSSFPSGTHSVRPVCSILSPEDESQEVRERYVLKDNEHRICWHKSKIHTASGCGLPNPKEVYEKNDTRLQLRLSQKEKEKIERNAQRCGMSVSRYVRQCCLGREPRTRPPDVFWELLEELYAIVALLPVTEQHQLSGLILQLQEAV